MWLRLRLDLMKALRLWLSPNDRGSTVEGHGLLVVWLAAKIKGGLPVELVGGLCLFGWRLVDLVLGSQCVYMWLIVSSQFVLGFTTVDQL